MIILKQILNIEVKFLKLKTTVQKELILTFLACTMSHAHNKQQTKTDYIIHKDSLFQAPR